MRQPSDRLITSAQNVVTVLIVYFWRHVAAISVLKMLLSLLLLKCLLLVCFA